MAWPEFGGEPPAEPHQRRVHAVQRVQDERGPTGVGLAYRVGGDQVVDPAVAGGCRSRRAGYRAAVSYDPEERGTQPALADEFIDVGGGQQVGKSLRGWWESSGSRAQ